MRVLMISRACLVGAYQRKLEEIAACEATLIVNRVAHRLRLAEIQRLLSGLEAAVQGGDR